jgi:hypothetical protein
MAVPFALPHHGLSTKRTSVDVHLIFYVMTGKKQESMDFADSSGGLTARFGVNNGGTFDALSNTTYSIMNGLARLTQLVIGRYAVVRKRGEGGRACQGEREND